MNPPDSRRIPTSTIVLRSLLFVVSLSGLALAQPAQPDRFVERLRHGAHAAQDRVDTVFHDACEDIRRMVHKAERAGSPAGGGSVDVRVMSDGFRVRVYLPGRDVSRTSVTMEDGARLRIASPAGDGLVFQEQTLVLEGAAAGARPETEVDKARYLLVIKVPGTPVQPKGVGEARSAEADEGWPRDVLRRMERMRRDMERMMGNGHGHGAEGFSFFGSTIDIKEEANRYVVRMVMPDTDLEGVRVSVEGKDLRIDSFAAGGGAASRGRGQMTQFLVLPGAVEADKIRIERGEGGIEVSLPKAEARP